MLIKGNVVRETTFAVMVIFISGVYSLGWILGVKDIQIKGTFS